MGLVRKKITGQPEQITWERLSADALRALLGDPDPDVRREAALGLEGVEEAVPDLLTRVILETEPNIRDSVLTTVSAYDTEAVAGALAVHLASDDAALRTAAAEALARMPRSMPALLPSLVAAPDHDVRVMTVMVLADLIHPDTGYWLTRVIRDDPHPNVVTAAIDALLPLATAEHAPLLEAAARRFPDDPFLRFTVQAALPGLTGTA
ncbi:HEAT repeat protein [Actinoplanes lutulentus]|uniref:HEAT repeat protein n=1 Tax=Actinoplanes lutulentus TaxID=1287878 RepID=A0A327Z720_9ACTN|nr:HEAT repeat domain-containing protein [Actinoplanes lutulentus]MBB2942354.1 HEAT repeat protein [Actinoplanes lutulentus]RAK33124.1 HEAT repeat protein [Actinoplanes lutulentus]